MRDIFDGIDANAEFDQKELLIALLKDNFRMHGKINAMRDLIEWMMVKGNKKELPKARAEMNRLFDKHAQDVFDQTTVFPESWKAKIREDYKAAADAPHQK